MSWAERNPIRTWLRRLAAVLFFIFAFSVYVFDAGADRADGDCG